MDDAPMSCPPHVRKNVAKALVCMAQTDGGVTKNDVVLKAMGSVGKRDGYGLSLADQIMAARFVYTQETDRQLKKGLGDNHIFGAMKNAPVELVQVLTTLPAWIAQSQGPEARWVMSLTASPAEWKANYEMKFAIANRTLRKAGTPKEVHDYLVRYGLGSLSEAMQ